jgi:hypothetical protein
MYLASQSCLFVLCSSKIIHPNNNKEKKKRAAVCEAKCEDRRRTSCICWMETSAGGWLAVVVAGCH